jgi:RNA polymerase sigma-70 factor (ECF subfamily)
MINYVFQTTLIIEMKFRLPGKTKVVRSDEELLIEFTSTGDIEVLGELYSGYMHLVYGVCLKYLKNREESKDSVMQIFEKLIVEIPRHKLENFRSWLHVVTKNYCLMQLRSRKSQDEKMNEWMNDSSVFMENSSLMHPIDEDQPDIEKALADCIERLKGEQKECIRQFYYENRCYNEIALKMDLNEKKVKSHLQNAKRNLKLCLEEKHDRQE